MIDLELERKAFEELQYLNGVRNFTKDDDGSYCSATLDYNWHIWVKSAEFNRNEKNKYIQLNSRKIRAKPIRIQFNTACQLLDVSRLALRSTISKDPTFPKPIKMGTTKQAPVFFDYQEIVEWHNANKAK